MSKTAKDELLAELHRLANETGRTPTKAMMAGRGDFKVVGYLDTFGSWKDALAAADFNPEERDAERYDAVRDVDQPIQEVIVSHLESNDADRFFRGQLMAELLRIKRDLGRTPRLRDMREYGRFSSTVFESRFGSWTDSLESVGITANHIGKIETDQLLADFKDVADRVEGPVRTRDIQMHGQYSLPTYYDRFETWDDVRKAAGMKVSDEQENK